MPRYEVQIVRTTAVKLAALIAISQPAAAHAQGSEQSVVEKLKHGEINWTDKTVLATGSGAPDLKLPNVAAIRLNAERAAKINAYRNILETLKGLRISGKRRGRQALSAAQVRTQVEGIVQGCKIVDTRYYSDGGVDVVLRCPLDGGLATSLAPVQGSAAVKATSPSDLTGLILDATGLGVKPSLHPKVSDGDGRPIYAAAMVAPNALRAHGAVTYVRTVQAAKALPRLGKKPLVVKVARLGKSGADLVVQTADVAALSKNSGDVFAKGRVVVVTGDQ